MDSYPCERGSDEEQTFLPVRLDNERAECVPVSGMPVARRK